MISEAIAYIGLGEHHTDHLAYDETSQAQDIHPLYETLVGGTFGISLFIAAARQQWRERKEHQRSLHISLQQSERQRLSVISQ